MTDPERIEMTDSRLAYAAVHAWGREAQIAQVQEELAELIVALSHFRRGREGARGEVLVEMVDVHAVLAQVIVICGLEEEEILARQAHARERLAQRIVDHHQRLGGAP